MRSTTPTYSWCAFQVVCAYLVRYDKPKGPARHGLYWSVRRVTSTCLRCASSHHRTNHTVTTDYKVVYLDDDNDYRVDTLQDKTLPTVGAWKSVTEVEPNEEVEGGHVGDTFKAQLKMEYYV